MGALHLAACLLSAISSFACGLDAYAAGACAHGELAVHGGQPIVRADGSALAIGTAIGTLCSAQVGALTRAVAPDGGHRALARIPEEYRGEVLRLALTAHVDAEALATANLVVDAGCSALAAIGDEQRPTLIARNMDFAPVALLGPGTLVEVLRRDSCRPLASIGWPGFCGVVSGMNDGGLCACVLLNLGHQEGRVGEPICFRLRRMLERAGSVDEAARLFVAAPVASSHYVFVADAQSAAVMWQDDAGFHRQDARDGWLACTNAPRDRHGEPTDARGQWLAGLRDGATRDPGWMRRALAGCWLPGLNAQAMVLIPARLRLQLATGSALTPAALGTWRELDLGPLLRGEPIAETLVSQLGRVADPLPRYDSR